MLIQSVHHFAIYKNELLIVKKYIQSGFIGGLILAILGSILYVFGFFFTRSLAVAIGFPLFITGIFLLWLGGIGLSVLCFKLYEEFKSTLILISGVFFTIMGTLSLISWTLIHIETRSLIAKVTGPSSTVVVTPPPPHDHHFY